MAGLRLDGSGSIVFSASLLELFKVELKVSVGAEDFDAIVTTQDDMLRLSGDDDSE